MDDVKDYLRQPRARTCALVLAAAAALALPGQGRADDMVMWGPYWGDTASWDLGRLPNADDNVFLNGVSDAHMEVADGIPYAGAARNVHGGDMIFIPGSQLIASYYHLTRARMQGGTLTAIGGVHPSRLGHLTIRTNISGPRSMLGTNRVATMRLTDGATVDGVLELRGLGRYVNEPGSVIDVVDTRQSSAFPRNGRLSLAHEVSFVNEGQIRLNGQAGIDVVEEEYPGAVRFENAARGVIVGRATDSFLRHVVVDAYLHNAGQVLAAEGLMVQGAGGAHGGSAAAPARLGAASGATLLLRGEHEIRGPVLIEDRGGGFVGVGEGGRMSVVEGGLLRNDSRFFSEGQVSVQRGGTFETLTGSYTGIGIQGSGMEILSGGIMAHRGHMQLHNRIDNSGRLDVHGSIGHGGDAASRPALVQRAGVLRVHASGSIDLTDCCNGLAAGSFAQLGGFSIVDGWLRAGSVLFAGGVVGGSGTIAYDSFAAFPGVTVLPGVTVRPGNSPGTLTIDGNLLAAGATLEIEIGGSADNLRDLLRVTGDLDLSGASVEFLFIDGYLPAVGDSFGWLDVGGDAIGLDSLTVSIRSDAGTVEGYVDRSGRLWVTQVTAIPEPASAALWLAGLALVAARRLRRAAAGTA